MKDDLPEEINFEISAGKVHGLMENWEVNSLGKTIKAEGSVE